MFPFLQLFYASEFILFLSGMDHLATMTHFEFSLIQETFRQHSTIVVIIKIC